jgi:hypothetical protein
MDRRRFVLRDIVLRQRAGRAGYLDIIVGVAGLDPGTGRRAEAGALHKKTKLSMIARALGPEERTS